MSNNHYLFEHDSLLAIPPPPRSSSRNSIRSDLGLDKPLPPLRRTSSENFVRDAHHLTALPERAATPAFSVRSSRLHNRPSKISLFNLFNRSTVEIHDDTSADVSPMMPSLSAVYSQAIKATIAHTSSADEMLRPHMSFRSATPSPHNIQDSRGTGELRRLSKLQSRVNISVERKVFALIPGHLLQYSERGSNDRLPERSLQLTKDSIVIASDLVPGKPYTIQITEATTVLKANAPSSSTSLLTRLKLRGFNMPTKTPSILMIFSDSVELEDWLRALRREITSSGGLVNSSIAIDHEEQDRFDRADSLEPVPASRRASVDTSDTVSRPGSRKTSRLNPLLRPEDEALASPVPPAHHYSTYTPSLRSYSGASSTTKSVSSPDSEHRLPRNRLSSEPVLRVRSRFPVTGTQEAREGRRSSTNGPSYDTLAESSPHPSPLETSVTGSPGTTSDFALPISRFSADSGIEINVRLKSSIQEPKLQPHGQLRTSSSFSSMRSVRSIIPPTIREVSTPASPKKSNYAPRPFMRQFHSRRALPLPVNSNGRTLYRSTSQTTLQSNAVAAPADRRHSHSWSNNNPRPQQQTSVPAESKSSVTRPAIFPGSEDGTARVPLRKPPSKLSLFPSPPTSPPDSPPPTSSALIGLSLDEVASRSNRPAPKRPASFQARPRPTPITTNTRSVTSSDVRAPIGLGIRISPDKASTTNDFLCPAHARPDDALSLPQLDLGLPVVGLGPPAPPPQMPLPEIPQNRQRKPQLTRNA